MRAISLSIAVLLFSAFSFAADIEPVYEALKQSAVNYEPDGAVCEQVARLKLVTEFPENLFQITSGIEYHTGGNTIGELDVLVLDRATHKVVLVAEVKCWKNLQQAMDKLKAQRDRFTWTLSKYAESIRFVSYAGVNLQVQDFDSATQFRAISQLGGIRRGFDMELEFTLSELKALRMKLLKCQSWGECAKPK